ncbi:MAG TPA: BolA family transcriptional regulator [Hellea balneolensis]|uniref:BolA family transcriptional regulator n=1 Tax=Hellea balneolensis TaxID=287478 RepID=A0A7C3C2B0_9PROT|nr:BolA family transcriptional regulator [Hellea balneolensis]
MGHIASLIKEKLEANFSPSHLEIIDQSHQHAHHAGAKAHAEQHGHAPGSGESHFHVIIVSEKFKGQGLLARHRAVMDVLADVMDGHVHALSLDAKAP